MALVVSGLSGDLKDLFEGKNGYPENEDEAGTKWAQAYRKYAANALAGTTLPQAALLSTAESKLASALASAFKAANAAGVGGAAVLPALLDAAFVAFWLTPPIAFALPPTAGVVTVAPPGVVGSGLSAAFAAGSAPGVDAAAQATAISAVLDTWTKTVMVVNTTPPSPPLPPVPLT